jgi:ATPase subunit of ABC transporter with duplicated ATPase domains
MRSARTPPQEACVPVLTAANVTIQFGAKPLFENISVKFGEGNRYGLIGANGCGKSTLMKILGGDLEPSAGNVALDRFERLGKLMQDQFGYEDVRVLDVVLMGHTEMWQVKEEKDAIYANPDATEDDYVHAAELEAKFAEYDGYTAEARAGELLLGIGIAIDLHDGPMSAVAPGWKLRVLLAQALFADPDVLLLDEPTNNLDINSIRWLEDVLNERSSTMVIISHDRHFLNSVCTHMADLDYGTLSVYPGNYDDYRHGPGCSRRTPRRRTGSPSCRSSCAGSRPTSRRRGRRRPARGKSRRYASTTSNPRRGRIPTFASTWTRSRSSTVTPSRSSRWPRAGRGRRANSLPA